MHDEITFDQMVIDIHAGFEFAADNGWEIAASMWHEERRSQLLVAALMALDTALAENPAIISDWHQVEQSENRAQADLAEGDTNEPVMLDAAYEITTAVPVVRQWWRHDESLLDLFPAISDGEAVFMGIFWLFVDTAHEMDEPDDVDMLSDEDFDGWTTWHESAESPQTNEA